MRLILIRHAQTEGNRAGINQGWQDTPLTPEGIAQAERLRGRLAHERIDIAYVSDLGRALETVRIALREHHATQIIQEPRLREQNLGALEGKPAGSLHSAAEKAGVEVADFEPEGGESIRHKDARVAALIKELRGEHPDETVALITHGGIVVAALLTLLGWSWEEHHDKVAAPNTAVSILEVPARGKAKAIIINDVSHLDSADSPGEVNEG